MDKKEKVTFILEQLRLTLADKDHDRAQIICKKIATKYFDNNAEEDVQKLKLKYFKLMIQLGLKDKKYLEISKHFIQVYETPIVKEEPKHVRYSCLVNANGCQIDLGLYFLSSGLLTHFRENLFY